MKQSSASANLFLDMRTKRKDGRFPVKIRICHLGKQWAVGLKYYLTPAEYDRVMMVEGKKTREQKQLQDELLGMKRKAQEVLDGMRMVTPELFRKEFYSEAEIETALGDETDMKYQFGKYISELRLDECVRTASIYEASLKSFLKFRPTLPLQYVDRSYLDAYQQWMKKQGNNRTTTFIYLRNLRSVYNRAIKAGIVNAKFYPFKEYPIGKVTKSKKALQAHEIDRLYNYVPINDAQQRAKDYFFMCYFTNGCNPSDIMRMRYRDMSGEYITFERKKTFNTLNESKPIVVYVLDDMREIMRRQGNSNKPSASGNDYIFPVLNDKMTEEEKVDAIFEFKRLINKILNRLRVKLGIEGELNLSVARPSMATTLKHSGISVAAIGDMMGHTDTKTTEHYLSSIPSEMVKVISGSLMNFRKKEVV